MKRTFILLFFLSSCKNKNQNTISPQREQQSELNENKKNQEKIEHSDAKPLSLTDLGDDDFVLSISPESQKIFNTDDLSDEESSDYIELLIDNLKKTEGSESLELTGVLSDLSSMLRNIDSHIRTTNIWRRINSAEGTTPSASLTKKTLYPKSVTVNGKEIEFKGKIIVHSKRSITQKVKSKVKIDQKIYDLKKINMNNSSESFSFIEQLVQDLEKGHSIHFQNFQKNQEKLDQIVASAYLYRSMDNIDYKFIKKEEDIDSFVASLLLELSLTGMSTSFKDKIKYAFLKKDKHFHELAAKNSQNEQKKIYELIQKDPELLKLDPKSDEYKNKLAQLFDKKLTEYALRINSSQFLLGVSERRLQTSTETMKNFSRPESKISLNDISTTDDFIKAAPEEVTKLLDDYILTLSTTKPFQLAQNYFTDQLSFSSYFGDFDPGPQRDALYQSILDLEKTARQSNQSHSEILSFMKLELQKKYPNKDTNDIINFLSPEEKLKFLREADRLRSFQTGMISDFEGSMTDILLNSKKVSDLELLALQAHYASGDQTAYAKISEAVNKRMQRQAREDLPKGKSWSDFGGEDQKEFLKKTSIGTLMNDSKIIKYTEEIQAKIDQNR